MEKIQSHRHKASDLECFLILRLLPIISIPPSPPNSNVSSWYFERNYISFSTVRWPDVQRQKQKVAGALLAACLSPSQTHGSSISIRTLL